MTEWAHLPNAEEIEAIASARAIGPTRESDILHDMAGATARAMAEAMAKAMVSASASGHAPDSGGLDADLTIRAARHALTAWPESSDLLSLTPDALRTIIETCDGDVKHQAVLLLPAVIARSTT